MTEYNLSRTANGYIVETEDGAHVFEDREHNSDNICYGGSLLRAMQFIASQESVLATNKLSGLRFQLVEQGEDEVLLCPSCLKPTEGCKGGLICV
jgi:hypothetical protein